MRCNKRRARAFLAESLGECLLLSHIRSQLHPQGQEHGARGAALQRQPEKLEGKLGGWARPGASEALAPLARVSVLL